ncbi:MAG: hypothetical protein KDE19_19540, partial [Caldilineaceae bacterium]|nr:hypothetical protein [Caldilineaceae bacterium]
MPPHPASPRNRALFAATGFTMVVVSLLLVFSLIRSPQVLGQPLFQEPNPAGAENTSVFEQRAQQPAVVNGRAIYAVPIVSGSATTAILQSVQGTDIAYVVHNFPGWGKSVSTAISWFRCADIVQIDQYLGNQIEVEAWFFLTEQERREIQAACTI